MKKNWLLITPNYRKLFTIYCLLPTAYCLLLSLSSCSVNKTNNEPSLKKYFDDNKVDGCFSLLNNANGEITVYNMALDTQRFSPASTFKIVNSLIGLQTGVITNDTMQIKWDGKTQFYPNGDTAVLWNKNLVMVEAFKANALPYYQEVARRIGKPLLQTWVDSIGYGNKN